MKLLKYVSIFAVVCILMTCLFGTALAAGSKTGPVEVTPTDGLTITEKQDGDPILTAKIAASKVDGCKESEIVDVYQWNMTAEKLPVELTFKVDLKENQKGYVYHWNGSDWDLMGEVNTAITFNSLSPVGVAIRQLESSTPAPVDDGGKETSPATGSNGLLLSLACAALVMGGAAIVAAKKKI